MSATHPRKKNSRVSFDIDPRQLHYTCDTFMDVNEQRIQRAQRSLDPRQQIFLDALPLLLHTNHPLLPGYVSNITPCGISGFEPEKRNIRAVRNLIKSFNYNDTNQSHRYIHNISLMGSCGTVAHSKSSDMDFWVCYDPDTSYDLLGELEQKLRAIEKWAASLGLEVYFFPMDLDQFKSGQRRGVSGEDCGTAQHYLLLDEFYRTSLLIAGRKPLWWMVPPQYERQYKDFVEYLIEEDLIDPNEYCDFGGIPTIPAGEFIGAGMWQLYKGVESPYKSVIKILLTEVYASEYPQVSCLSHLYKEAIYENVNGIDELDPYVMLYRKLEKYLKSRNEEQRLELVRRCFYFKVNEPLSRNNLKGVIQWRRTLMEELVSQWGWQQDWLAILDSRKLWKVHRTIVERKALVNELNHSYRFLSRFARDYKSSIKISQQDMTVLGRKLYAAFERKSGKIELVNPNISKDISEDDITIAFLGTRSQYSKNNIWVVYSGVVESEDMDDHDPIKRAKSIVELVGWCYFNEILNANTRITLRADKTDINEHILQRIVQTFKNEFPRKLPSAPQENFHSNHRPIRHMQFVNVGIDPMRQYNDKGFQKISEQTDALNYSGTRTNLVQSVENITINSWHEIIASKHDGAEAIVECILEFLRGHSLEDKITLPMQEVMCFGKTRPEAISQRIIELFTKIESCFYGHTNANGTNRFLLELEHRFYLFEFKNGQPHINYLKNYNHLIKHLSKPKKDFSPITLDKGALNQKVLKTVCRKMLPNNIQIFYTTHNRKTTDIYVVDELGSIQYFSCPKQDDRNYLINLSRFLQSIWYRVESESGRTVTHKKDPILFYKLSRPTTTKDASATLSKPESLNRTSSMNYSVEVVIDDNEKGQPSYTIFCDHKEFSELEFGNDLFHAVAKHLLSLRKSKEPYPIYVTDIDITNCREDGKVHHQTTKYLQYKLVLESRLNAAVKKLN